MDNLFFFLHAHAAMTLFASLALPLGLGFLRYQARYLVVLLHKWTRSALDLKDKAPLTEAQAPSVLLVLPTELRNAGDLTHVKRAITSVLRNGYLGHLTIVAAVDDAPAHIGVYRDLLAWIAIAPHASAVKVYATSTGTRSGYASAIDNAIQFVRAKVARGEIDLFPSVFFAMDAESFLAPNAIEHMVQRLRTPRWGGLRTSRPMMVLGNVQSDPRTPAEEKGLRAFFTVRGQLSLALERESLTSSSTALVCTWAELQEQAPRWTAFVEALSVGEWCRWSIGKGAKTFSRSHVMPAPVSRSHANGVIWLASMARYTGNGAIVLDLPKTPAHALLCALRSIIWTPVAHEPQAHAYLTTPATVESLFRQRMPAAPSAAASVASWSPAFAYHWAPGLLAFARLAITAYVHLSFAWALLVWPLTHARSGGALAALALVTTLTAAHLASTVLALSLDRHGRRRARALLAVPLSLVVDLGFTLLPAAAGCAVAASSATRSIVRDIWTNVQERLFATSAAPHARRSSATFSGGPMIISDLSRLAPQSPSGRMSASVPYALSTTAIDADEFASLRVPYLTLVASGTPSMAPEPRRANPPPPSAGKMLSVRVPPPSNVVSLAAARAKINRQIEAMAPRSSGQSNRTDEQINIDRVRSARPDR